MNEKDLLLLNFEEVRRRSVKIWRGIPEEKRDWKPDDEALSCAEMITHVLGSEYYYYQVILNRGSVTNPVDPYDNRVFSSIEELIAFSESYRDKFLRLVQSFDSYDLSEIKIDRTDLSELGYPGYIRSLGDFLLRIAYHEAVHTGQLLDYLRTMRVSRPDIWD